MAARAPRSRLGRDAARERYVQLAFQVLLTQAREEALAFDAQMLAAAPQAGTDRALRGVRAIGLFATLDGNEVAARDGKTRGVINHLFGSQNEFQVAAMTTGVETREYGEEPAYPQPKEFDSGEAWARAVGRYEWARGPNVHEARDTGFSRFWLMWLTQYPYLIWSRWLAEDCTAEFDDYVRTILVEELLEPALQQFGREPAHGLSLTEIGISWYAAVEGVWLSKCVTTQFAGRPDLSTLAVAENALAMIWHGSTRPIGSA